MRRLAQRLLARTWMWVRGPSPPEAPEEERVRLDFMSAFTLVAWEPRRKKTQRRAKGADQGCRAWMIAVRTAAKMPKGVRDL